MSLRRESLSKEVKRAMVQVTFPGDLEVSKQETQQV